MIKKKDKRNNNKTSIWHCKQNNIKVQRHKIKKGNKFLTYFKPIFFLAPEKILGVEKGNISLKCVKFLAGLVLSLLV